MASVCNVYLPLVFLSGDGGVRMAQNIRIAVVISHYLDWQNNRYQRLLTHSHPSTPAAHFLCFCPLSKVFFALKALLIFISSLTHYPVQEKKL